MASPSKPTAIITITCPEASGNTFTGPFLRAFILNSVLGSKSTHERNIFPIRKRGEKKKQKQKESQIVISLGQLPSAGCDKNHIHILSAGAQQKASDHLRNVSSQRQPSLKLFQRAAPGGPGRRCCPVVRGSSWIPGAPSHPPFSNSPFLPHSKGKGKVPEERPVHSFCPYPPHRNN